MSSGYWDILVYPFDLKRLSRKSLVKVSKSMELPQQPKLLRCQLINNIQSSKEYAQLINCWESYVYSTKFLKLKPNSIDLNSKSIHPKIKIRYYLPQTRFISESERNFVFDGLLKLKKDLDFVDLNAILVCAYDTQSNINTNDLNVGVLLNSPFGFKITMLLKIVYGDVSQAIINNIFLLFSLSNQPLNQQLHV